MTGVKKVVIEYAVECAHLQEWLRQSSATLTDRRRKIFKACLFLGGLKSNLLISHIPSCLEILGRIGELWCTYIMPIWGASKAL
jgi:hypothetical protein